MEVDDDEKYRRYEHEWSWESNSSVHNVQLSHQNSIVTFHPKNSSGTAIVRGNKPFKKGQHYYWEVKMMTRPYGTDVMIGVGTKKVDLHGRDGHYCSLLGIDKESWGLSYLGCLHHNGQMKNYAPFLSQGSTIGVHLDTWRGTLQYFVDKKPFGVAFTGLRDLELYPMACSTAAASKMRIMRCISEPVSLQMECLGLLSPIEKSYLETTFPFLQYFSTSIFANVLQKNFVSDEDVHFNEEEEVDTNNVVCRAIDYQPLLRLQFFS